MADITLKLCWYRLQEIVGNMAESADKFFDLSKWDFLDLFFAGWILTPLCMYFIINFCIRLCRNVEIGRLPEHAKSNGQVPKEEPTPPSSKSVAADQCLWINSVVTWLYLHYNSTPQVLDGWLRSLNEYCDKLQNDLQPRFGTVQPGSLPPKVLQVRSEPGPGEKVSVNAVIDCQELEVTFYVTPLRRFEELGFKLRFQKIHGELCIQASCQNDEVHAVARFVGHPDLIFTLTPTSQYVVDTDFQLQLNELVSDIFHHCPTNVTLSSLGRYTEAYERIKSTENKSELAAPPKPPRFQDRRLLVKVIKGSTIGAREFGCTDPYCIVAMDEPPQRHTTSVVKNTINPFWDEHFLFDLTNASQEVNFELFDRDKPPEDDFLGCCSIKVDELRRHPTVRQIIPLVGRPNKSDKVSGSITVEFLFMEPAEAQQYELDADSMSPRRKIETSRTMLPGGTRVTTTTTTTERPKERIDPTVKESPNKVEKTEQGLRSESPSPYSDRKGSRGRQRNTSASQDDIPPQILVSSDFVMINGVESVTDVAIRELEQKRLRPITPSRTSTLVITSVHREPADIPIIIKGPDDSGESFLDSNPNDTMTSQSSADKSPSDNVKKHKSFAKGLKKRFIRSKDKKPRSHSVERSSGIREDNLLKPPSNHKSHSSAGIENEAENLQHLDDDASLSKSRTLGGSIKRLFQRRKKGDTSRDSSLSRSYVRGESSDVSRESSPPLMHRSSIH